MENCILNISLKTYLESHIQIKLPYLSNGSYKKNTSFFSSHLKTGCRKTFFFKQMFEIILQLYKYLDELNNDPNMSVKTTVRSLKKINCFHY